MGMFTNFTAKLSKHAHEKRARKAAENSKHSNNKMEYLLDNNTPFDITEAFRNLKAALSVSVPKKDGGVIISFTSAYPEEGKTTVSVNLALMFALSDAKVLLIDADIRKGRVARYFKHKSKPGLSDYLSGQNTLEEILHKSTLNDNLTYVTCGTHSPKPYELLESEQMKELLQQLRGEYDYILIDTPPVLLISDALAFTPYIDGTVLICRHQYSFVSDIERTLNQLTFSKANVLGVIVNDYKAEAPGRFQGKYKKYYRYYRYSSYTYGFTDPTESDEVIKK